jgi:hypothetical protein
VRRFSALAVVVLPVAAAIAGGCNSGGGGPPEPEPRPSPAITRQELGRHLAALQRIADAHGGNRAAGTPGYDASADYVAARLRDAGWNVSRQQVPFTYFGLGHASLAVGGRRLARLRQFQVPSYSGSGRAEGRLSSFGDGCEPGDFDGLRDGQIPLVDRGGCFFRQKASHAERAGADALLVDDAVRTRRGLPSGTLGVAGAKIPVVLVAARALGGAHDGTPVKLDVDARSRKARAENVIAETPGGTDDRVVMAGGHLDSVAGGPGINDNGSGVGTLIEAAEAIGTKPPGARVRLGFWTAEELGLYGSRRYVSSLSDAERRRIRAYVNLDMVGSPNAVPEVYGDGDSRIAALLRRAYGGHLGEILAGQSSDHAAFQSAGIPVNGFYTGSLEPGRGGRPRDPCYHLACDTVRNVDRSMLLRMARASAKALLTLSRQAK